MTEVRVGCHGAKFFVKVKLSGDRRAVTDLQLPQNV